MSNGVENISEIHDSGNKIESGNKDELGGGDHQTMNNQDDRHDKRSQNDNGSEGDEDEDYEMKFPSKYHNTQDPDQTTVQD